ncbi:MAG: DNA damage-inducible protein D [Nitrospira sp.]|nr:DNA damage-inducible protein D [Nitrospira sp.]
MKTEIIQSLTDDFESYARQTENGVEFWLARDLQCLLGYTDWRNFLQVLNRAKVACEVSEHRIIDHFVDANKMVSLGSGSQREVPDMMLTRYACYLIAQNGDPRKEEIAFAQTYFAVQTRKLEIIQKRILEAERISARRKLASTEKELSGVIYEQTGSDRNFGMIRSKGDKALFGYTTEQMKNKWKVPKNRALADFAPTIVLKAKDFATEITIFNAKANQMQTEQEISGEHITNNESVRNTLIERGIRPEDLPPSEDVKKVERQLQADEKKGLKNPKSLDSD